MPARAKTKVGSWELGDLEKSYKEGFEKFLRSIEKQVRYVEAKNQILANTISATDFKNLLLSVENISERMSIAAGYSHLLYATDTSSNEGAALMTKMDGLFSHPSYIILFFFFFFLLKRK